MMIPTQINVSPSSLSLSFWPESKILSFSDAKPQLNYP